ncbi:ABC transporter substrate-binding protein [Halobacillus rhizosphaerae]|uniref:ABC transporter substrate-binding protein n=1 Tax=Halobacillus rhizosphaerae TaxID=3064889 RepID=UPI00398AA397
MKKSFLIVLIIFMVSFMSACSGNGQEASGDANGKKEVLIWHHYTGSADVLDKLIDEYNSSQDKFMVKEEYVPFNEMNRQLSVGSAGGSLPDLIIADTVNNVSLASMGILADLSDKVKEWGVKEKFLNGPMNSTVYKDKNYGLPLTTNALGLFYNKQLLKEAGISKPPSTWDELEEAAGKLTTDDVKGFGLSAVKSEESTFQFYPFIYSAGGDYRNLDSPEVVDTFQFIKDLLDKGYMSQDVLTATQDDLSSMFEAGNLAMMINGPWMIDQVNESGIDYGVTYIPKDEKFSSVTGGDNISITKDGNVEGAWDFAKWLLAPEQNEQFAKGTGYFPTRKDVLEEADYWKNEDKVKEFIPIMEVAEARGPSANWPKVSESIQLAIQEVLTGTKSPEKALKEADQKIEKIEE